MPGRSRCFCQVESNVVICKSDAAVVYLHYSNIYNARTLFFSAYILYKCVKITSFAGFSPFAAMSSGVVGNSKSRNVIVEVPTMNYLMKNV